MSPEVRFYDFAEPIEDEQRLRRSSLSPSPPRENLGLPPVNVEHEEPQSQTQIQTQLEEGPYPSFDFSGKLAHLWGRLHPCMPDYQIFDLARTKESYTIGRNKQCDFQISSPKVSSTHCTITYQQGEDVVTVQDHSRNGTFVSTLARFMTL